MENNRELTKDQKRELRRQEWQEEAKKQSRNTKLQKLSIWSIIGFIFLAVFFVMFQIITTPTDNPASEVIKVSPVTIRDITNGSKNTKVTLMEYSDFQCPACADYQLVIDQILNEYKDKILFVYRMFPLVNSHKNAFVSAQAAYAANKQGKFFEMSKLLLNRDNQLQWGELADPVPTFTEYAKSIKMDLNKFKNDLNSNETKSYVQKSADLAMSDGILATPTFILNGYKISPSPDYKEFKKLIDTELNKK